MIPSAQGPATEDGARSTEIDRTHSMKGYQSWTRSTKLAENFVECTALFAGLGNIEGHFTFGHRKRCHVDKLEGVVNELPIVGPRLIASKQDGHGP